MRLSRVKYRLWLLMIVIAVAALATWGVVLVHRSVEYRRLAIIADGAERHEVDVEKVRRRLAEVYRVRADSVDRAWRSGRLSEHDFQRVYGFPRDDFFAEAKDRAAYFDQESERSGQARQYWAQLKAKYLRAARYPFLLVAPDPPRPL